MTTASAVTTPIATDAPTAVPADLAPVVSLSRVEANRRNALRSTGPRTTEGRARSSQNARKHGLFCKVTVLSNENIRGYRALRRRLWSDLQPVGAVEELLFDRVVSCAWRLARATLVDSTLMEVERAEASYRNRELSCNAFIRHEGPMEVVSRYEAAIERSFFKALAALTLNRQRSAD